MNGNKRHAIIKYNRITGENKPIDTDANVNQSWGELNNNIKDDVYKYYEYVQLKSARFDCTGVGNDNETGRIISMTFEFNGKFE